MVWSWWSSCSSFLSLFAELLMKVFCFVGLGIFSGLQETSWEVLVVVLSRLEVLLHHRLLILATDTDLNSLCYLLCSLVRLQTTLRRCTSMLLSLPACCSSPLFWIFATACPWLSVISCYSLGFVWFNVEIMFYLVQYHFVGGFERMLCYPRLEEEWWCLVPFVLFRVLYIM